ncbi:MAG: nitrous oxide reductase accessory protein NosL [Magnetococcus sp. XQGC-1]
MNHDFQASKVQGSGCGVVDGTGLGRRGTFDCFFGSFPVKGCVSCVNSSRNFLIVALLVVLPLWGCEQKGEVRPVPLPQEPTRESVGFYCNMNLLEHAGPKAQIFMDGKDVPLWFSSVRESLMFRFTEGKGLPMRAFYVNDMGKGSWEQPAVGGWVEAARAVYVVDSRREGIPGQAEWVSFSSREAASSFMGQYGGKMVSYEEIAYQDVLPKEAEAVAPVSDSK